MASGEQPLWHNDDFELKAPSKQQVQEGFPTPAFHQQSGPSISVRKGPSLPAS